MLDFTGKNIIITGASSGIGEALTLFLLGLNANVIGIARNKDKLEFIKSTHNNFSFITKDLAKNIDANSKILASVFEQYGQISGLVLNAGVQETRPIVATNYERTKDIFKLNYFANISIISGIKKKFVAENGLSIVGISSITSKLAIPGIANYSASKSALESLIRTTSVEYEKMNVRANSISLGHVKTELLDNANLGSHYLEKLSKVYTNGLVEFDSINSTIGFLLSSGSKHINGSKIALDSGVSNKFLL